MGHAYQPPDPRLNEDDSRLLVDQWNDGRVDEVRIGSRGDSLVLSIDELGESISVTLRSGRLLAETLPRDRYDLRGLAAYLADLAETAGVGWEGTKVWESLEHDIRLESTLRDGRVTINAVLRDDRVLPANDGWSAHLDITVDPGEELRLCATQVWHLLEAG